MPRCPVCKTQCTVMTYERVPLHHCGSCGGYWVSPNKLDVICDRREVQMPGPVQHAMMDLADASNTVDELFCISCGSPMRKAQFKYWDDIQIDHCPKCRMIWLDAGELEKCQIYWEYMQDHPEAWGDTNVLERKAMIESALIERKAQLQDTRELAEEFRRRTRSGAGFTLFNLFG